MDLVERLLANALMREGFLISNSSILAAMRLGKLDVVYNWASFRRAVLRELKRECREDVLLWFGSGETAMPMIGALHGWRYVVSALELYDDVPVKRQLLGKIAKGATAVTACQLTRAYLTAPMVGFETASLRISQ